MSARLRNANSNGRTGLSSEHLLLLIWCLYDVKRPVMRKNPRLAKTEGMHGVRGRRRSSNTLTSAANAARRRHSPKGPGHAKVQRARRRACAWRWHSREMASKRVSAANKESRRHRATCKRIVRAVLGVHLLLRQQLSVWPWPSQKRAVVRCALVAALTNSLTRGRADG